MLLQELLKQVPLFRDLSPEELRDVVLLFHEKRFRTGDRLLNEGEHGDDLLVIGSGRIRVHRRGAGGEEITLAELSTGTLLGELALIDAAPRSAGATALLPVTAHRLLRADFMKLVIAKSPAALKILRRVAISTVEKLRNVNDKTGALQAPEESALDTGARLALRADPLTALSRVPFFKAFKASELRDLTDRCVDRTLDDGEELIRQGSYGSSCFFLLDGRLRLILEQDEGSRDLDALGPGAVVGHFSMLDGNTRSATVKADGMSRVLELPRVEYDSMFSERSHAAFKLTEALARLVVSQLRVANRRLTSTDSGQAVPAPPLGRSRRVLPPPAPAGSSLPGLLAAGPTGSGRGSVSGSPPASGDKPLAAVTDRDELMARVRKAQAELHQRRAAEAAGQRGASSGRRLRSTSSTASGVYGSLSSASSGAYGSLASTASGSYGGVAASSASGSYGGLASSASGSFGGVGSRVSGAFGSPVAASSSGAHEASSSTASGTIASTGSTGSGLRSATGESGARPSPEDPVQPPPGSALARLRERAERASGEFRQPPDSLDGTEPTDHASALERLRRRNAARNPDSTATLGDEDYQRLSAERNKKG